MKPIDPQAEPKFEVVSDERVGEGGFLKLRRLRLRAVRPDGTRSEIGLYDFVERPMGADAVVLALWHRAPDGRVQVLLREATRVPLYFGRPGVTRVMHTEVVAGILESGEDHLAAIRQRAADEAFEEAGVRIAAADVQLLGPPSFPTAGMCPELLYMAAAEVRDPSAAVQPPTDGSPFEEGGRVEWLDLEEALRRCSSGEIDDMKTELILRRLRDVV
jgi:ADP-ribose pyrophosphatase